MTRTATAGDPGLIREQLARELASSGHMDAQRYFRTVKRLADLTGYGWNRIVRDIAADVQAIHAQEATS